MAKMKPIDVTFREVRPAKKRWYHDGDAVEAVLNTVFGTAFLGLACYCVHLFLSNNF
jgi:hypothetical protein